jgi:nucleoside-diphosphate-sugar epimerase
MNLNEKIYIAGHKGMVGSAILRMLEKIHSVDNDDIAGGKSKLNIVTCDHSSLDLTKPDGSLRKLLNSQCLKSLGWKPKIELEKGLKLAYKDFKSLSVT